MACRAICEAEKQTARQIQSRLPPGEPSNSVLVGVRLGPSGAGGGGVREGGVRGGAVHRGGRFYGP